MSDYFNSMISEKLKAYVYALADPRTLLPLKDRIFYVGKGNGNRCFSHAALAQEGQRQSLHEREHKLSMIRAIQSAGHEVEVFIISHGMEDDEAFALEAALIPLVGETNAVAGHGDDRMWLQRNQISELYDNPVQRSDIDLFRGNLLFVSLNRQDTVALRSSGAERDLEYLSLGLGMWTVWSGLNTA